MSSAAQVQQALPRAVAPSELILLRFRSLARRRAMWLESLALGGRSSGVDSLLDGRDTPQAEADWFRMQSWAEPWNAESLELEEALEKDHTSFLARLRAIFGLAKEERDLLEACAAVAIDASLARICGYLQSDPRRTYVTEELVAALYGHGRCGVWAADSALFRWELVVAQEAGLAEPRALHLDPQIRDRLLGRHALPELLCGAAALYEPALGVGMLPVEETASLIERHLHGTPVGRLRVILEGPRGSGRRTLAGAISGRLRLPLLLVNADELEDRSWRRAYLLAQRHAYLDNTAIGWFGESLLRHAWPASLPPFPVQFAIVDTGSSLPPLDGVNDYRVKVPALNAAGRSALWLSRLPASHDWPAEELALLSERYRVQPGDIVSVAAAGVETAEEAALRVREISRGRLSGLAQLLRCSFTWSDLVVPAALRDALEDIVFEANHRAMLWEDPEAYRLFPQGQGLLVLLSGPPGTGKTMGAQVVAGALGYDLFRVDLAGVVSKWVGETSQNFERILSRAADMHAIVLFDECDAVFSKRTSEVRDAQDKFVNTDAAYLLQAVESFPGIAFLATNQKGNIDPAFIRRLRYVLEFTKPDASQRLEIWRKVVAGLSGVERQAALDPSLQQLSEFVEATGAQIKFAVLGAIFAAKRDRSPVELRHLLRGLDRELAKEGRALGVRERERILSHGT